MKDSLVSVIIPCYNVEAFIRETLESALSQTYDPKEIICVDNGSTDGTMDILKEYENRGSITLLVQERRGACAARNMGWMHSSGNWIQFLDGDDLILPDKTMHQMNLLEEQEDIPFIAGGAVKFTTDGKEVEFQVMDPIWHGVVQNRLGNTVSNLFNRAYLEKISGWDERLKSSQEYDLMFRILQMNDAVLIDQDSSLTRIRSGRAGAISMGDTEGNKYRFLELSARICSYMKREKGALYDSLPKEYHQAMYERIRLNSIRGFGNSIQFYKDILPPSFSPVARPYDPAWFTWLHKKMGFPVADFFQRLRGLF